MTDKELFDKIQRMIRHALLEQDAETYHGRCTDTGEKSVKLTQEILELISTEEKASRTSTLRSTRPVS